MFHRFGKCEQIRAGQRISVFIMVKWVNKCELVKVHITGQVP